MVKVSKIILAAEIDPETPYNVVDTQTGKVVGKFKYKNRNQARSFRDKKDNEYGAVRYTCKLG